MSLVFLNSHQSAERHDDAIWGAAWTSADTAVSVSADGSIRQWSSVSGQRHPPNGTPPAPHTLALISLSVSPDGKRALYNSLEGHTWLLDLESGDIIGSHESYMGSSGDAEPSWSISLNPSGSTYASSNASGNVTIHSADPSNFGERLSSIASGRVKFGMNCRHSPDGRKIALALETGQIFVFDLEASSLLTTFTSHAMAVRSLSWSADSSLLMSASEDRRLVLHDIRSAPGNTIASFTGHTAWALSVDIAPEGTLALSGSADKTVKVWDIGARSAVSTIQDTGEVWSVSWRPKPSALGIPRAFLTGGEDGFVRWWKAGGT
ncbi:hypothetical protein AGABI1DRAFT_113083 [Agaricus bisporus var. burnettii JB137-S8]|uniref:Uncharacterized protein n=2 Tax=Agaricus bisporus var. burnettii TaxID=192524 RepID=K5WWD6_AGABU|nr:uncharacterized protein AGABI1DRAFT_113083 [Agaricus bisporus var. burnettii JB137-S8]EKM79801.1 hypothetical protein AGABI1DRAFT_113083 [Agaricus bisporus var. burnettii JB137-S8]KAF7775663.1 hypothetical protein Agabi119p4_4056 [Agaricus bisporus var. burnettii]